MSLASVTFNLSQGIGDTVSSARRVCDLRSLAIFVLSCSLARLILASLVNVVVSDFYDCSDLKIL